MRLLHVILAPLMALNLFAAEQPAPRPSLVVTTPIEKGVVNPLQTYVGTLYYDSKSNLAAEFEGSVASLHFSEGEAVKKGTILLTLDTTVLQANIAAQKASIEAAVADLTRQERDLERTQALLERNSISQTGYDQIFYGVERSRANLKALRSQLDALEIQKAKMQIKAPFSGIVTKRNVDVGEWVSRGTAVATIIAPKSIEARLNIPSRFIHTLKNSESFTASIEGRDIEVKLKNVIPQADITTRTFPVELSLSNSEGLIEGMRIDVQVPTLAQQDSLMVPRDAVIKRFGQNVVFAAVDGKAVMIPVQVIGYNKDQAAISGMGLVPQMRIVIKGNERIFPNMPVMEKGNS